MRELVAHQGGVVLLIVADWRIVLAMCTQRIFRSSWYGIASILCDVFHEPNAIALDF